MKPFQRKLRQLGEESKLQLTSFFSPQLIDPLSYAYMKDFF